MSGLKVFKFLDSYSKEDGPIFFGRESETEEIYQRCSFSKTLVVYGRSGTGKTSIIRCGLGNAFNDQDWLPVFVRRSTEINRDTIRAIRSEAVSESEGENSLSKEVRNLYLDHFKPVYLIFDQFEELFIFGGSEEIERFFSSIKSLIESDQDVHLIFVIREEYLAYLTEAEEVIPEFLENRIRIEHLTAVKLRETVEKMCEAAGIELEEGFSEELTERMTSGKAPLELSYLQVYLDSIRKKYPDTHRFSKEMIEALGSFGDVLGDFLQRQLNDQPDPAKAETVLKAFVSAQGTKRLIDTAELKQLTAEFGVLMEMSELDTYVNRFVDGRILRQVGEDGKYELRHDTLAKVIYERITLAEKELLEAKQFVHNAYNRFQKNGTQLRDEDLDYLAPYAKRLYLKAEQKKFLNEAFAKKERRQKRKLRLTQVGVGVLLLLLIGAGYLLYQNYQDNQLQARIDESYRLAKLSKSDEIGDPMLAFLLAEKAHELHQGPHTHNALLEAYDRGPGRIKKIDGYGFIPITDSSIIIGSRALPNTFLRYKDGSSKIQTLGVKIPGNPRFSDEFFIRAQHIISYSGDTLFSADNYINDLKVNKVSLNRILVSDGKKISILNTNFELIQDIDIPETVKFTKFLEARNDTVFALFNDGIKVIDLATPSIKNQFSFNVDNLFRNISNGLILENSDDKEIFQVSDYLGNAVLRIKASDFVPALQNSNQIEGSLRADKNTFTITLKKGGANLDYARTLLFGEQAVESSDTYNLTFSRHDKSLLNAGRLNFTLRNSISKQSVILENFDDDIAVFLNGEISNDFRNSKVLCSNSYGTLIATIDVNPRTIRNKLIVKFINDVGDILWKKDFGTINSTIDDAGIYASLNRNFLDIVREKEGDLEFFRLDLSGDVLYRKIVDKKSFTPSGSNTLKPWILKYGTSIIQTEELQLFIPEEARLKNNVQKGLTTSGFRVIDDNIVTSKDSVILLYKFLNNGEIVLTDSMVIQDSDQYHLNSLSLLFITSKKTSGDNFLSIYDVDDNKFNLLADLPWTQNIHLNQFGTDSSEFLGLTVKKVNDSYRLLLLTKNYSVDSLDLNQRVNFNFLESGIVGSGKDSIYIVSPDHAKIVARVCEGMSRAKHIYSWDGTTPLSFDGSFSKKKELIARTKHSSFDTLNGYSVLNRETDFRKAMFDPLYVDKIGRLIFKKISGKSISYFDRANFEKGLTRFSGFSSGGAQYQDTILIVDQKGFILDKKFLPFEKSNGRSDIEASSENLEYFILSSGTETKPSFHLTDSNMNRLFSLDTYPFIVYDRFIITNHRLLDKFELFPINGEVAIEMVREQGRLGEVRDFTEEEIEKYQLN